MSYRCWRCGVMLGTADVHGGLCENCYSQTVTTSLRSDNDERIRGALARAYCTERNKHKVLDPDLIEDMVIELNRLTPKEKE